MIGDIDPVRKSLGYNPMIANNASPRDYKSTTQEFEESSLNICKDNKEEESSLPSLSVAIIIREH